jgi:hypothetical protein
MTELVPCEREREFGESERAKSAAGGGGVCRDEEEPAPPQPAHTKRTEVKKVRGTRCGNRPKDRLRGKNVKERPGGRVNLNYELSR